MSNLDRLAYNRAGQLFTAANVSAKSVIAVTAAMTGVILYNPPGSGKVLAVVDVGWVWTTAPAAVHNIGLALGAPSITVPTSTTAIGSGVKAANNLGNAGTSVAQAYDAATLPAAPVIVRWSFGAAYGSGVGESPHALIDYVDGALIVAQGSSVCFAAVTTTAVGMGSISWIELDA